MMKTQLEDDMVVRIRKSVRDEFMEEIAQLKAKLQTVEVKRGEKKRKFTTVLVCIYVIWFIYVDC